MGIYERPHPGDAPGEDLDEGKAPRAHREGDETRGERLRARLRVELEAGLPLETRVVPRFSDFCVSRYKAHAQTQLRSNTWSVRKYQLATLCDSLLGELRMTEVSTDAIERYKLSRRKKSRRAP